MMQHAGPGSRSNMTTLKVLTYLMFAMTTDSVGIIIPEAEIRRAPVILKDPTNRPL